MEKEISVKVIAHRKMTMKSTEMTAEKKNALYGSNLWAPQNTQRKVSTRE